MKGKTWLGVFAWVFGAAVLATAIIYRTPPGRDTTFHPSIDILGLVEFDNKNPGAPEEARGQFVQGVNAQMAGDFPKARSAYKDVLRLVPKDPVTRFNLELLRRQD